MVDTCDARVATHTAIHVDGTRPAGALRTLERAEVRQRLVGLETERVLITRVRRERPDDLAAFVETARRRRDAEERRRDDRIQVRTRAPRAGARGRVAVAHDV